MWTEIEQSRLRALKEAMTKHKNRFKDPAATVLTSLPPSFHGGHGYYADMVADALFVGMLPTLPRRAVQTADDSPLMFRHTRFFCDQMLCLQPPRIRLPMFSSLQSLATPSGSALRNLRGRHRRGGHGICYAVHS